MRIVKQNGRSGRSEAISLPKNFVEGVDKCRLWVYYSVNITKMAVKRRVGLRIDPYQKARAMEKGRKQEAENGLGAVWARRMSAKSATGAPVTASGCKQHTLPQHRGCICKGTVNQGGTTEVCSCLRPCRA